MRTRMLQVDPVNPEPEHIQEAATLLRRGGLVAFPTETVYGLGANLEDPQAMTELYTVKARPFEKQATLHLGDRSGLESFELKIPPLAEALMDRFWPGPLTLVLRHQDGRSLGFRVPKHPVAQALLLGAKVPVVAPSANLSGQPPPTTAQAILKDFQDKIDMILDAGPTRIGLSSTVVDLSRKVPQILRRGAEVDAIEELIQKNHGTSQKDSIRLHR